MHKKLIQIDLDGVLNNYDGHYEADKIASIKDGAFEFVQKLSNDFTLELFTVRDKQFCEMWLEKNNLSQFFEKVTNIKNPYASVFIDDREINFDGNFENVYEKIIKFKPYWKN